MPQHRASEDQNTQSATRSESEDGRGVISVLPCGRSRSWPPPGRMPATVPLLWRSAAPSPGQAAGAEGLWVSPLPPSRCGSTRLFWSWRHLLGGQLLSVEGLIKKKKKESPSMVQQRGLYSSSHEWVGCMVLKRRTSKSMRKC